MKAFYKYTVARLAVFGVCWLVLFGISLLLFEKQTGVVTLVTLMLAMLLSAIVSAFVLAGLRDELARNVQGRAERMTQRLEESRSAEDVD